MLERPAADELVHHRVAAEPVGIVDVLIASEAREDRLAQETREAMAPIPARARISDEARRHIRQAERVVQLTMEQQYAVGAY